MKRFKAFTLTEILTGTMLQAGFVLVLMGAFYMLVNFQAASTKLITAREKGQRVLAYIENRVIHAGLGLHKCTSSKEIRESFDEGLTKKDTSSGNRALYGITLPVAVTSSTTTTDSYPWRTVHTEEVVKDDGDKIYVGDVLTVLYAISYPKISEALVLDNQNSGSVKTISGDVTCKFAGLSDNVKSLSDLEDYAANKPENLCSYKVTASSGAPLYISKFNNKSLNLTTKFTGESVDIASGSELLTLQCEKIYVAFDSETGERALTRVNLADKNNWRDAGDANGTQKYYENGIIAVYFELNASKNTLDCYVLASGGQDPSLDNPIPKSWPNNTVTKSLRENWSKSGYGYNHHEVYVSRASYKLHNVGWSSSSGWTKN